MNEKDPQTHAIIGAAMQVHRELGPGFLEGVYQEALAIEFGLMGIPFATQVELPVHYRERRLACAFRADFVCYESIVVELKALKATTGVDEAQLLNYLKATRHERGLLLNFGASSLQFKPMICSKKFDPQISQISQMKTQ